tara:strand:+ start:2931 stop:4865 length:1935 start_codon:yes stop_codon:yes gene_type:complete
VNYSIKNLIFVFTVLCLACLNAQSLQELQNLQNEYKKALERQALQKPVDVIEAEKTAKSTALPDKLIYSRKDIESLLVNTEKLLQQLKFLEDSSKKMPYVGYDFFTLRDSISFWQNLPISKNYKLGPGDEVIISLWGESNSNYSELINRDGQVFIENIGILNLGGKSLSESKKYILSKFSRVYSTLIGDSPKSFIDLTIGELKSVNVHFVGFVNIPGVHMIHPFSNVISGLIQAGGVDIKGSLRDIKVIRDNKLIASVDLYNYLIEGRPLGDFRLLDQDLIYISPRKSTIPLTGRALRVGYYEMLESETIHDLLNYAGGRERQSSKFLFFYRNSVSMKSAYIINSNETKNYKISQGDSIFIPKEPYFNSFVNIQGQIKNPGKYPFNEKMKLKDIVGATMSLEDKDFVKTMDLSKINIFRKNSEDQNPLIITSSLQENINLNNGDHITVSVNNVFKKIESVIITGEIKTPGIYPVNNLTSLADILSLSGGPTSLALDRGIEIFRDSLKIGWENELFLLENGDSLNVLKKSGLVLVKGEVNVPGYITYKKGDSIKKYIRRAGGYTSFAEKGNAYIIYPNGTSVPIKSWLSPKVTEGSSIVINQRTISGKQSISGWEAFAAISSQASGIATTLLSLSLLINQSNNGN